MAHVAYNGPFDRLWLGFSLCIEAHVIHSQRESVCVCVRFDFELIIHMYIIHQRRLRLVFDFVLCFSPSPLDRSTLRIIIIK